MAFDFPSSPTDGQTFTAPTGYVYVFATPVWKLQSSGMAGPIGPTGPAGPAQFVSISDTAPGSPTIGQMWWNSTNGNLFIWYHDGSSGQWVQVNNTGAL